MDKVKNDLWLAPDYYKEFKCKCGDCRNCCCSGWRIGVNMKDYFKLIGMECPDDLHRRIETAFTVPEIPTECRYRVISPNWLGNCPILSDTGLCLIQRDYGENALPDVCRLYPRSLKNVGGIKRACLSNSCEGVIELLMKKEKISLGYEHIDGKCEDDEMPDADNALILQCFDIMADKSISVEDRLKKICGILGEECPSFDAETVIKTLFVISRNAPNVIPYVEELQKRYSNNIYLFKQDNEELKDRFDDLETVFGNVLFNHMLYVSFPFTDGRIKKESSVTGLCLTYDLMKTFCSCHIALESNESKKEASFADALAAVFHLTEHTPYYFNAYVALK